MLRSSSTRAWTLVIATAAFAAGPSAGVIAQTRQTAPVPMPFPGAGSRQPPTTKSPAPETEPRSPLPTHSAPLPSSAPAAPVVDPAPASAPNEATLAGVQIYPTAEFIDSFDAGNNQQYFLYGTNATFTEIVTYYRTVLKSGGRELSKAPGIQQFDLGRFQDTTMAYPPSVVVKDYTWNGSMGYLAIKGTTSKRYKTIIQVVPPAAR